MEMYADDYCNAIDSIDLYQRKMLKVGKVHNSFHFHKAKGNISNMLQAKTKSQFEMAQRNITHKYDPHIKAGKAVLLNFRLHKQCPSDIQIRSELKPDPRAYYVPNAPNIPT